MRKLNKKLVLSIVALVMISTLGIGIFYDSYECNWWI